MIKLIKWLNPPRYRFIGKKNSEGCQSGRMSTLGKRVYLTVSWVRIPFPPPYLVLTTSYIGLLIVYNKDKFII